MGWYESFAVASPFTGRRFVGVGPMKPRDEQPIVGFSTHLPHPADVLEDLFDTLAIDLDDLVQPPARPFQQWDLWRQDDNGVRALVVSFTGRAKAEAALEQFEALGHKQAYWLEPATGAGA